MEGRVLRAHRGRTLRHPKAAHQVSRPDESGDVRGGILVRSLFNKTPSYPEQTVAKLEEVPVGEVKLFACPTEEVRCLLVRTAEDKQYCTFREESL